MQRLALGDVRDHRRERGRLAGAGRPGDEHEAVGDGGEVLDGLRQLELIDGHDLDGDAPEDRADGAALHVEIGAEPRHARDAVAEVDGEVRVELLPLRAVEDRQEHLLQVARLQRIGFQRDQLPLHADQRRPHRLQMQVGSVLRRHEREELVQAVRGLLRCRRSCGWDRHRADSTVA